MGEIFMIMIGAVLTENFVFTKFLGICPFLGVSEKPSTAFGMGMAVTFVMSVASAATWVVYYFVLAPFGLEYLQTIAFILIIASLVQVIEMFMKKYFTALYTTLGIFLPLITTNCAVLGAALINIEKEYTLINSLINGAFSAVGFTLAILIFAGVRERMSYSDPPAAFKGVPLALVAAGLLAMAFAGFYGIDIKL
ncbi:MAG: RnfABCDGE type electron transport complex subunit A [Oscillospiraceae bacterium]|jgi:electron transport complex protein RnfA|nr:RnfABCDGE type electron transport complex subunit A [Oscillospiraceae bacterium]